MHQYSFDVGISHYMSGLYCLKLDHFQTRAESIYFFISINSQFTILIKAFANPKWILTNPMWNCTFCQAWGESRRRPCRLPTPELQFQNSFQGVMADKKSSHWYIDSFADISIVWCLCWYWWFCVVEKMKLPVAMWKWAMAMWKLAMAMWKLAIAM